MRPLPNPKYILETPILYHTYSFSFHWQIALLQWKDLLCFLRFNMCMCSVCVDIVLCVERGFYYVLIYTIVGK